MSLRFRHIALNSRWLVTVFILFFSFIESLSASQTVVPQQYLMPAPPFHLQDLDGKFHHLSDFRGRVLIVNFWASWCTPCREELPSMNRAWSQLKQEGISMLAINVGEDQQAVSAFIEDYPIDFGLLLDSYGNISQRWQVRGLPTTFILNAKGEIVYRVVGDREWDDASLLQQVRDLKPTDDVKPKMKWY
ncbi:MAG: TlpA family protein disulfide reductase [Candidatus Thiodiazotropha sp. (ex Lucinoma borealis)]|nr:TlpA family protein disulfide reductase [Candidatus Thiodiazotropha sp. (ex Lucinoma borealis)]MCU7839117.1 TlpA family protein disulfide reductase [Candidatus Thiodiazotropha sp. (ex Troendleina suluensis)]MCU7864044.1 TlpA family protein disulfide reductase [Candidatus Thiodiazotropha sp. (ex Lucinoma borealis)]MCU7867076.1 TlpA family protein disulfide reductase [Candidatus Thiodiazotropha sp. (ex Lucinoma borealis)]